MKLRMCTSASARDQCQTEVEGETGYNAGWGDAKHLAFPERLEV